MLKALAGFSFAGVGLGGYAAFEPWRLNVTRYALTPTGWPSDFPLRLAVVADLHVCDPWMNLDRVRQIVARTNAVGADAILLLGDYIAGDRIARMSKRVPHDAWAAELAKLKAPLGVHAVMGNHDWWEDRAVQDRRAGPIPSAMALKNVRIPVYENDAVRLEKAGRPFWLAGLGDQWAFWPKPAAYDEFVRGGKVAYDGIDDLPGTLAKVTDGAPVILMAHEPDIFPAVPERVSLTISGHTHGGQIRVAGFAPIVPSKFGRRYTYGHIIEDGRHLVVSGGLGCSGLPLRFGSPPEVVVIDIGATGVPQPA